MFTELANILGPILIMTLIGYLLGRSRDDLHIATLGSLVILVATPALIFSTLTSLHVTLDMLADMAGAALLCMSVSAIAGAVLLHFLGLPMRTFLPSLALPNSGNMGLPLALLAFGPDGLKLGISYFFVVSLVQHTLGYAVASGSFRFGVLLRQPLVLSVLCSLVVIVSGVEVPEIVGSTTRILGGMMIPTMLIMLGNSLATMTVSDLRLAFVGAVGRLVIGVGSALVVIQLLSLSGVAAGTVFIMATMPSAIVTYVYAQRFRSDAGRVAGVVVVSTLLTFACLPVLISLALRLTN